MKDFIKEEFELYKELLQSKEILVEVENPKPPKVRDIRELQVFPPIYLVLLDELSYYNEKLFKAAVFTKEIELGYLLNTPVLRLDNIKAILVQLPFWVYLEGDFLYRFSRRLGSLAEEELPKLINYAENKIIPKTLQGEYIRLIMQRLAPFNTLSLLNYLEKLENLPQVIQFPTETFSYEEPSYAYAKAAAEKNVFKGKNYFAIIERKDFSAQLILYLPQEYIGKKVVIKLRGGIIFEGELSTDKLLIENFPVYLDYSFIEEDLNVEI